MAATIFITGGTRSGKSDYAQRRAEAHAGLLLYVATATPGDAEMAARIARHRIARGERWDVLEEPLDLAGRLPSAMAGAAAAVLDCVTLWLSNLYFAHGEERAPVLREVEGFCRLLPTLTAPLYLVSNEVGYGIVPENRLAREFRDLAGEANQLLAAAADEAWLVVAGLPLRLK
ncbi:MAG: bifunctional adenosylcobinamide kinase/adenosylcobinamide-phosphate guanylyltransferase [Desulfuromonadales bacterium GWD2_61_12]|nr:MAG: bifunctional adenosylcobinamide kinase/adenosylcobinamide-phosphate guanylyltransferase [Desulfuromonadales bacterium GWD2_61_12]HBT83781.1 bifunctional adenosylcobinamide kinase/adenosylcobinamide-phosphate guanylyltransferase [Desulfuromonas sp.]